MPKESATDEPPLCSSGNEDSDSPGSTKDDVTVPMDTKQDFLLSAGDGAIALPSQDCVSIDLEVMPMILYLAMKFYVEVLCVYIYNCRNISLCSYPYKI